MGQNSSRQRNHDPANVLKSQSSCSEANLTGRSLHHHKEPRPHVDLQSVIRGVNERLTDLPSYETPFSQHTGQKLEGSPWTDEAFPEPFALGPCERPKRTDQFYDIRDKERRPDRLTTSRSSSESRGTGALLQTVDQEDVDQEDVDPLPKGNSLAEVPTAALYDVAIGLRKMKAITEDGSLLHQQLHTHNELLGSRVDSVICPAPSSQTSDDRPSNVLSRTSPAISEATAQECRASAQVSDASARILQASAEVSEASARISAASARISAASARISATSSRLSLLNNTEYNPFLSPLRQRRGQSSHPTDVVEEDMKTSVEQMRPFHVVENAAMVNAASEQDKMRKVDTRTDRDAADETENEDLELARFLARQLDQEIRWEKHNKSLSKRPLFYSRYTGKTQSQMWYELCREQGRSYDRHGERGRYSSMPGSYPKDRVEESDDTARKWLKQHRPDSPTTRRLSQEMTDLALARAIHQEQQQQQVLQQQVQQDAVKGGKAPNTKDCIVCASDLPPLAFPVKPPSKQCTHPVNVCTSCLQEWVKGQLDDSGWQSIRCPECPTKLSYTEMKTSASTETFARYDALCIRTTLGTMSDFSWCLRPNCGFGQENVENAGGAFMECGKCGFRQCLKHRCEWHDDETCQMYDYRVSGQKNRDEERMNEDYLAREAKKCPGRKCGAYIEKTYGCDHMTCRKCNTQFCYKCCALYTEIQRIGNEAHKSHCPYHTDNLDASNPYPH